MLAAVGFLMLIANLAFVDQRHDADEGCSLTEQWPLVEVLQARHHLVMC